MAPEETLAVKKDMVMMPMVFWASFMPCPML